MTNKDNIPPSMPSCISIETINNIKFTPREIDIITCILGRRSAKKIAASLKISPKTVENHIRNIMQKLDCNSRESIIDFIERAKEAPSLKQRYSQLICSEPFDFQPREPVQQEVTSMPAPQWQKLNNWKFLFTACLLLVICLSTGFTYLKHGMKTAQSELSLPAKFAFLQRPELIKEMHTKLEKQKGLQTIALVGIGGAGKKILARQYARGQDAKIIWEVNAETRETIVSSLERLAYALLNSDEDKQIVKSFQETRDPQRKEERLLLFIRDKIKAYPKWVFIYYNVNDFSKIKQYFPHDLGWGNGKVIITTTDNNIQNNKYVNQIVQVGELNQKQCVELFVKILHRDSSDKLTAKQLENIKKFLNQIPPFPLDVSVASYYIKETKTPYDTYVKYLRSNSSEFNKLQEGVLNGIGEHEITRYNIVSLSLRDLINSNAEYKDLLESLTLFGSKHIPRELFYAYKNPLVVDNFIHDLNKYSLTIFTFYDLDQDIPTFSIHKSIQDNIVDYLKKDSPLLKNKSSNYLIFAAIEKYTNDIIKKEDSFRMLLMLGHCLKFMHQEQGSTDSINGRMAIITGTLYYYLGNFVEAQEMLSKGTEALFSSANHYYPILCTALARLGNLHREFGQFDHAKSILEKGLVLYQQHLPHDSIGRAFILRHLARVYRNLGDYEKAKALIEESLALYKATPSADPAQVAHSQAYLGKIYKDLGNYVEAKNLLEDTYTFSAKNYGQEHPRTARILRDLGQAYYLEGDFVKGEKLTQNALEIFKKLEHLERYTIFENLAELHAKKSERALEARDSHQAAVFKIKVQDYLNQALEVVQTHFPADSYHIMRIQSKITNLDHSMLKQ